MHEFIAHDSIWFFKPKYSFSVALSDRKKGSHPLTHDSSEFVVFTYLFLLSDALFN